MEFWAGKTWDAGDVLEDVNEWGCVCYGLCI